jgi:hypothetical protein
MVGAFIQHPFKHPSRYIIQDNNMKEGRKLKECEVINSQEQEIQDALLRRRLLQ